LWCTIHTKFLTFIPTRTHTNVRLHRRSTDSLTHTDTRRPHPFARSDARPTRSPTPTLHHTYSRTPTQPHDQDAKLLCDPEKAIALYSLDSTPIHSHRHNHTRMQNFCAIQAKPVPGQLASSIDGISNNSRKASYTTVIVKPVFHKAHPHKVALTHSLTCCHTLTKHTPTR
jgi:hypothetical protein